MGEEENADFTALEIDLYAHLLHEVPLPRPNPGEEAAPIVLPVFSSNDGLAALTW